MDLPEAVVAAIVAGGLAALGYLGKLIVQAWQDWRTRRAGRLARLVELQALLLASKVAFQVQREQAGRLAQLLQKNHPGEVPAQLGLERRFSHLYPNFSDEERDLHSVIRGYTVTALHETNSRMVDWLRADTDFRTVTGRSTAESEFARQLTRLEAHLLLWMAKYDSWIPHHPEHALVYLADEERHGLGFPSEVETALENVLTRMRVAAGSGLHRSEPRSGS